MVASREGAERMECCLMGIVSVWDDVKVLDMDSREGCTTRMYKIPFYNTIINGG
jgi:hypothetical protein